MATVYRQHSDNELVFVGEIAADFRPDQIHFDWVRWCYASITKHFEDLDSSYDLYLEGDERTQQDEVEFAELRIDGPFISIPQKHMYWLDIEINVLCQTHVDPRRHYKPQVMVGTFLRAFKNEICVYKLGDGPFDDGSLVGGFHLQRDLKETIDINYYGIIKENVRLTQTTLEGHYRLQLWTNEG